MIDPGGRISNPAGAGVVLGIAFAFLGYGSALFAVQGQAIAREPYGAAALAVVHAFAAFIVLAVVAAGHQLVPVITGSPTAPARMAWIPASPIAAGFGLLIASFQGAGLFVEAGVLLSLGVGLWSAWTLVRLARAPLEPRMRAAIGLALIGFLAAGAIGAFMAFAFGGIGEGGWLRFAPTHALLAVVGFASAMIVAISYRFVPMFGMAHTKDGFLRFIPAFALPPLAALAAVALHSSLWAARVALAGIAVAVVAFVSIQIMTLRKRLRRKLDTSMRYAVVAWSFGVTAAIGMVCATFAPAVAPAAVVLALLGWIIPSIVGYSYKIVGFLAWDAARQRFPDARLAPLSGAVDPVLAHCSLGALTIGALGSAIAVVSSPLLGVPPAIYFLGVILSFMTLARILSRYRSPQCIEPSTVAVSIHPSPWSASSRNSIP